MSLKPISEAAKLAEVSVDTVYAHIRNGRLKSIPARPTLVDVDALKALQKRVDARIARLGFPADERPFAVHLTLARVPQDLARKVARPLAEAIEAVKVPDTPIPVREVVLMRSELRREGPVYTRLCGVELDTG